MSAEESVQTSTETEKTIETMENSQTAIIDENSNYMAPVQKQIAKLQNEKAKEVLSLRKSNEKHFQLPNGSFVAIIAPYDLHYLDENNEYQNIDTSLVIESNLNRVQRKSKEIANAVNLVATEELNSFRAPKVPFDVVIPSIFSEGYSISKENDKLTFIPIDSLLVQAEKSNASSMLYKNAWRNTDVTLEVEPDGLKESIILKSEDAPDQFSFEIEGNIKNELTTASLKLLMLDF